MYFATQSFQSPRKQIFIWRIYNRLVDFSRQQDIIGQDYLLMNPLYPNMKEIITEKVYMKLLLVVVGLFILFVFLLDFFRFCCLGF